LHNTGQAYQHLAYDFDNKTLFPGMGVRAKHQLYISEEEVPYYRVPTPSSELYYRTAIQQGQFLYSYITANLTPEMNFSIGYRGLHSLGLYRNALSSKENFRFSGNYTGKKGYGFKLHYLSHNYLNEENGGLSDEFLIYYLSGNPDYNDRGRLETRYTDAESLLKSRRIYIQNSYDFLPDSLHTIKRLQLGHSLTYEREYYTFVQDKANEFIGTAYREKISDSIAYRHLDNTVFARIKSPYVLGDWVWRAKYIRYYYGNDTHVFSDTGYLPAGIDGSTLLITADWKAYYKGILWSASAGNIFSGSLKGQYFHAELGYRKTDVFQLKAKLLLHSRTPDFIFQKYQSTYQDYNWYTSLQQENTRILGGEIKTHKWGNAEARIIQKDFYTYFDFQSRPAQYPGTLTYLKAFIQKDFHFGKFTWDTRLLYQKVAEGSSVLHLPEWLGESSLYFTDYVFKGDPLYLQTGINIKYFSAYFSNEFNPVINEFYIQNNRKTGGEPIIDIFVNGKVQTMRLYLKAENLSSLWGRHLLSTPSRPYRDMTIRFGVIWNFFM
jgi:hypothetical protein